MKMPVHHINECPDCNGDGGTIQWDWDGEEQRQVAIKCEGCDSSGSVTSCDRCDEAMPLPEAELLGYICGPCRAGLERGDAADEIARVRKWVA